MSAATVAAFVSSVRFINLQLRFLLESREAAYPPRRGRRIGQRNGGQGNDSSAKHSCAGLDAFDSSPRTSPRSRRRRRDLRAARAFLWPSYFHQPVVAVSCSSGKRMTISVPWSGAECNLTEPPTRCARVSMLTNPP